MKTIRITMGIRVTPESHAALKLLAAAEQRTMSEIFEEMIEERMKRAKRVSEALPVASNPDLVPELVAEKRGHSRVSKKKKRGW